MCVRDLFRKKKKKQVSERRWEKRETEAKPRCDLRRGSSFHLMPRGTVEHTLHLSLSSFQQGVGLLYPGQLLIGYRLPRRQRDLQDP